MLLSACAAPAVQEALPSAPQGEPPARIYYPEAPGLEFLTEEQKNLFYRVYSAAYFLMDGETMGVDFAYPLMDGSQPYWPDHNHEYIELHGRTYAIALGRYEQWDDFEAMMDGLFTPEYKRELLTAKDKDGTEYPLFTATEDGRLYFVDIEFDRPLFYEYSVTDIADIYELVSQAEGEIVFNLIAHYSEMSSAGEDAGSKKIGEYTIEYPIRFVQTEDGWRCAEFHRPY